MDPENTAVALQLKVKDPVPDPIASQNRKQFQRAPDQTHLCRPAVDPDQVGPPLHNDSIYAEGKCHGDQYNIEQMYIH